MKTKEAVRAEALAHRQALSETAAQYKSSAIAEVVKGESWFKDATTLALYATHKGEVDPGLIFEEAFSRGKVAAYPRVNGGGLVFFDVDDIDDLEPGTFGILEPPPDFPGERVEPGELDIVFVPGIAFDRHGHRLGFGHGYYDRFLPAVRSDTEIVGLAFACQIVPAIPHDRHDVPMTRIVTEEGIITIGSPDSDTTEA